MIDFEQLNNIIGKTITGLKFIPEYHEVKNEHGQIVHRFEKGSFIEIQIDAFGSLILKPEKRESFVSTFLGINIDIKENL